MGDILGNSSSHLRSKGEIGTEDTVGVCQSTETGLDYIKGLSRNGISGWGVEGLGS